MNTHDIELPPLPPLCIAPSVEPVDYPKVAQALMDYARTAIEADRKRRGEPVYLYRRKGRDEFVTCDKSRYDELSSKPDHFETKVLYTTPQPAEPVKGTPSQERRAKLEQDPKKKAALGRARERLRAGEIRFEVEPLLIEPPAEPVESWHDFAPRQHQNPDKFAMPVNMVDKSTHMWKRIEDYSREVDGKKIDIYLGDFLLYCPELEDEENSGVVIGYYSESYRGWYTSDEKVFPTHFMPLPEKPL